LVSRAAGALAVATANATVLFGIGAVVITPDVPLVLCWTAALRLACELFLPDGAGAGRWGWRWHALGAACGLALLSKYTAALLPLQLLATALALPAGRGWLRTRHPWAAALIAAALFAPVVVWNARHGWASFAFQTIGRAATSDGAQARLLGRYLALQLVAVGPALYAALLGAIWWLVRRARAGDQRAVLLLLAGSPGLALFTALSPFVFVKMNWVAPAYVSLLVGWVWWAREHWSDRRVRALAGAVLSSGAALTIGAHLVPLTDRVPFPARDDLVAGWRELASAVARSRAVGGGPEPLVVGWDYKTASELAFYLPGRPRTQSSGILGEPGLAYDTWLDEVTPGDLLMVADRRRPMGSVVGRLRAHCASVQTLAPVTVYRGASRVTTFDLWRCRSWRADGIHEAPRTTKYVQ
jgi:4-amino-4-deoxy-L-arabinose transferase-like glycosyltransferase